MDSDKVDDGVADGRFRFVVKNKDRRRTVTAEIQKKVDVRMKRLNRLEGELTAQKDKVVSTTKALEEAELNGDKLVRARFLKDAADRKLADLIGDIEETKRELAALRSNDVDLVETKFPVEEEGEASGPLRNDDTAIIARARSWADRHGVKDFVETVDIDGEKIDVIRLDRARFAATKPVDGCWPSFFSELVDTSPEATQERVTRLRALLACATPDMERMVGILTTPGMLHMIQLEAMTLRGLTLPVSDDPKVRERGLRALADCKVVDADEYPKNF